MIIPTLLPAKPRRPVGAALLLVLLAAAGCGPRTGDVSGQILFDGKPLPSGRVTFICEGGDKPVLTSEIHDGSYAIAAAPVGACKITVATFQTKWTPVPNMPKDATVPPPSMKSDFVRIPARYENSNDSGLSYEVKGGAQSHNIELTPSARLSAE